MEFLQTSPAALIATCTLISLCVGSFLNVVIHRLPIMMEAGWREECAELQADLEAKAAPGPEMEPQGLQGEPQVPPGEAAPQPAAPERPAFNLVTPRSHCPACETPITAAQNVPVLSWLVLGGKCAACKVPISARYPAVELLTGILGGLLAWHFGYGAPLAAALVLAWALVALAFIDYDTLLLPDDITLPLLWLGLLVNSAGTFVDLRSAVLGAAGGYLVLWLVYWGFKLVAKKDGMGYGDFKLLAAIGAWTGWQVLPFVIVVGAGLGAVIGGASLLLARQGRDTQIPFGPYLALGGIAGIVWGREAVIAWLGRFPT